MTGMTRRGLLRTTALVPVALAMEGCQSGVLTSANLQKVIDDFNTIADGVAAILPTLGTINGIGSGTVALVGKIIAGVEKVAGAVSSTLTETAAAPLVTKLETGVGNVIAALKGVSLPGIISTILRDAEMLLPVLKTAVGLVVPAQFAAASPLAVEAARARLKAAAASVS